MRNLPFYLEYLKGSELEDAPGISRFRTYEEMREAAKHHEAQGHQVRGMEVVESGVGGTTSPDPVECYRTPGASFPGTWDNEHLQRESLKK